MLLMQAAKTLSEPYSGNYIPRHSKGLHAAAKERPGAVKVINFKN